MSFKLPKLDKTMHMVTVTVFDPVTGRSFTGYGVADEKYQRWWQASTVKSDRGGEALVQADTPFYSEPTISNPPTQSQVQALAHAVASISDFLNGH